MYDYWMSRLPITGNKPCSILNISSHAGLRLIKLQTK